MDLLAALVDKSFVERDGERFRMLRTIHAFCAEQQCDADEAGTAHRAHAEHFLRLAESAAVHLLRSEQLAWLSTLEAERDNLHAALRWASQADPHLALRLASALVPYWWMRGRRSERPPANLAAALLAAAEQFVLTSPEPPRQPFLFVLYAAFAGVTGTEPKRRELLHGKRSGDPWTTALVHLGAGRLAMFRGELIEADAELRAALRRFQALGERLGLIMTLGSLGQLETRRANPVRTRELVDQALEAADLYAQRAATFMSTGELAAAAADYQRCAELAARSGSAERIAAAKLGQAELALRRGATAEAKAATEGIAPAFSPARCELADTRLRASHLLGRIAAVDGETQPTGGGPGTPGTSVG